MKTKLKAPLIAALTFFASFITLIVLVKSVDVARIGRLAHASRAFGY